MTEPPISGSIGAIPQQDSSTPISDLAWKRLGKDGARQLYAKAKDLETENRRLKNIESEHREMRTLLLRIHSARVAMNEGAVIKALNDVDSFFREPNSN